MKEGKRNFEMRWGGGRERQERAFCFAELNVLKSQHKNDLRNAIVPHLELNLLCTQ